MALLDLPAPMQADPELTLRARFTLAQFGLPDIGPDCAHAAKCAAVGLLFLSGLTTLAEDEGRTTPVLAEAVRGMVDRAMEAFAALANEEAA